MGGSGQKDPHPALCVHPTRSCGLCRCLCSLLFARSPTHGAFDRAAIAGQLRSKKLVVCRANFPGRWKPVASRKMLVCAAAPLARGGGAGGAALVVGEGRCRGEGSTRTFRLLPENHKARRPCRDSSHAHARSRWRQRTPHFAQVPVLGRACLGFRRDDLWCFGCPRHGIWWAVNCPGPGKAIFENHSWPPTPERSRRRRR